MELSISKEVWIFLMSLPLGIGIAVIYDVFRVFRLIFRSGKLVIFFQDLLFWICTAIIIFLFFFITNSGEIRGYAVLGALISAIVYFLTISKIIIKHLTRFIKLIKSYLRKLFAPIKTFIKKQKEKAVINIKKTAKLKQKLFKNNKKKSRIKGRGKKSASVRTTIHC